MHFWFLCLLFFTRTSTFLHSYIIDTKSLVEMCVDLFSKTEGRKHEEKNMNVLGKH